MEDPFPDVAADTWYAPYVAELHDLGIINGNPQGTFLPAKDINRAEFLKLSVSVYLYLNPDFQDEYDAILEAGITDGKDDYADVEPTSWYAEVVEVGIGLGFIEGSPCGNSTCFKPGDSITRAEASKIFFGM